MDLNGKELNGRWKIIQEQLICLWAFHKRSPGANEFYNFLSEGFTPPIMSLSMFTEICYFLLGLITKEERDKLIKWPLINIQGQVNFRKGVFSIVKALIEKYPHISLSHLSESYMIDPNHNQKKILDFIMKLANLAVYLTLNDSFAFEMRIGNELNASEIAAATTMIRRARMNEEKIIEENTFPISKFENLKMDITNKAVALKQENTNLTSKINKLKKRLMENGLVQKEEDCNVNYLKTMFNERLRELLEINKQLKIYSDLSNRIVNILKAFEEPVFLSAEDLGLENGHSTLADSTYAAYDNLVVAFDNMKCKDAALKEKEDYLKSLESIRNALLKERSALQSFLLKYGDNNDDLNINL